MVTFYLRRKEKTRARWKRKENCLEEKHNKKPADQAEILHSAVK
jgi:hypothetical protein